MHGNRVIKQEPAYDQAYNIMRTQIVSGHYRPGDRILETKLSQQLGVSRTPIREALRRLQQEGLVVSIPGKGLYVFQPSSLEIHELYECRAALEGMAANRAATRIRDDDLRHMAAVLHEAEEAFRTDDSDRIVQANVGFHDLILRASGNNRLIRMMSELQGPLSQYRSVNLHLRGRAIVDEHRQIFEALRNRDPGRSELYLREHLERDKAAVLQKLPPGLE